MGKIVDGFEDKELTKLGKLIVNSAWVSIKLDILNYIEKLKRSNITHYSDHKIYRNKEGEMHREGGPAKIWNCGTKHWFINGKFHRLDGPASDFSDGTKKWYVHNKELTEVEFKKNNEVILYNRNKVIKRILNENK